MAATETLLDDSPDASAFVNLGTDMIRRSLIARLVVLAGTGLVVQHWIGWLWTGAWVAAVIINQAIVLPFIFKNFVQPDLAAGSETYRENLLLVMGGYGTLLQMSVWVAAWIVGGDDFSFMAALCLCAALVHANTFMTTTRNMYPIGFWPPVLVCMAAPFLLPHTEMPRLAMAFGVAQVAGVFWLARGHAASLSQSATKLEQQWRDALDASRAKSQFLATMSHELRTPLNAMIGYSEILEENLDEAERADDADDARRIQRSARTLLTLINEILDLSKIEAGKMEVAEAPTNLREIVADVAHTTAHIAEENDDELSVELDLDRDANLTDGVKARQCLLNLVSNACKFTNHGKVRIVGRLVRDDLRFDVVDTGCGISPEAAAKLFQPFAQGDGSFTRKHDGTGLGLVITQRMARLLGGDVSLHSAPGRGSTFTLTIKVADVPSAAGGVMHALAHAA